MNARVSFACLDFFALLIDNYVCLGVKMHDFMLDAC